MHCAASTPQPNAPNLHFRKLKKYIKPTLSTTQYQHPAHIRTPLDSPPKTRENEQKCLHGTCAQCDPSANTLG